MEIIGRQSIVTIFILIILVSECGAQIEAPIVELTPRSLVVPLDRHVTFTCRVNYNLRYNLAWYNDSRPITPNTTGFSVSKPSDYLHTLMFDAENSLKVNNSNFTCLVDPGRHLSNAATLLILNATEPPIPENPLLNKNSTFFNLTWSPPYLWHNQHIDYFIVSITHMDDGSILYRRVNVSDRLSDRVIESYYHTINQTCSEVSFEIKAYNSDGLLNKSYVISGASLSDPNEFASFVPSLTTTVLFNASATPFCLRTSFEMPQICSYEEVTVEYTIFTHDVSGRQKAIHGVNFTTSGPGTVTYDIDLANLVVNKEYSLGVVVNMHGLKSFEIISQQFNTLLHCGAHSNQSNSSLLMAILSAAVFCILEYYVFK